MEGDEHTLRGPPKKWLTTKEANAWLQWPDGHLAKLVAAGLAPGPKVFSKKFKRYHWQAVVAIGQLYALGYIPAPPEGTVAAKKGSAE